MQVAVVQQRCGLSGARTFARTPRQQSRTAITRAPLKAFRSRVITAATTEEAPATQEVASANGTPPVASAHSQAFGELADLIRMVNETDIVELELKSKRFSLCVRKQEALERPEPMQLQQMQANPMQGMQGPPMYMPQMQSPPSFGPAPSAPQQAPSRGEQAAAVPPSSPESSADDGVEVSSPMSGTMYRAPAPGEPPFVLEGDRVSKGQTICIIEAMKLMNEIESECDGMLVKFLADNGSTVNPGQAIALVKP